MIKVGRKLWKNASDEEKISYCDGLFEDSKGAVQKSHFEWYMNYQFLEGNHYVSYNSVTNSLETPPRKTGEVRIVVNKVKSGVRAIKNYATRTEPKWETMPGDLDEKTILNAVNKKIELIKANSHYGEPIAKKLIPKEYKEKYGVSNLFRVELPTYWRMLYTLTDGETNIEIMKIYPEGDVICTLGNYPDCHIINLQSKEIHIEHSNFVSLCRKDLINGEVYDKCELAKILVSYKDWQEVQE